MITTRDFPNGLTVDLEKCLASAWFLSKLSTWTIGIIGGIIALTTLFLFVVFVKCEMQFHSPKDDKNDGVVVVSHVEHVGTERIDAVAMFSLQTVGLVIWGFCFVVFWLGFNWSRYCSDGTGFSKPEGIFTFCAVHLLFPCALLVWVNSLRDVWTGIVHVESDRLFLWPVYLGILAAFIVSPILVPCLIIGGIVLACRWCCERRCQKGDVESNVVDSGIDLSAMDATVHNEDDHPTYTPVDSATVQKEQKIE